MVEKWNFEYLESNFDYTLEIFRDGHGWALKPFELSRAAKEDSKTRIPDMKNIDRYQSIFDIF